MPSLADALVLTDRLDWLVNVELKSLPNADPRLLEAVHEVIRRTRTASRVLISSFDHAEVARASRIAPEIATGVLAASPVYRPSEYVRGHVRADAYHPSAEVLGARSDAYRRRPSAAACDSTTWRRCGEHDVPVLVYTVNDSRPGGLAIAPGRGRCRRPLHRRSPRPAGPLRRPLRGGSATAHPGDGPSHRPDRGPHARGGTASQSAGLAGRSIPAGAWAVRPHP